VIAACSIVGSIVRRVDRRVRGRTRHGFRVREHALAGEQRPARLARQLLLEHELETVLSHLGARRVALGGVDGRGRGRDRPERADDLAGDARDR
jgi:hypothetical protein